MTAPRTVLHRALLGVVALLLVTACESGTAAPAAEAPTSAPPASSPASSPAASTSPTSAARGSGGSLYVALGDSFAAAPLVPTTDLSDGCLRSDRNYPRLLARRLTGYELVDVTCSGASSVELTQPQQVGEVAYPPQLDALSEEVDLVTLTIGGNDFGIFGSLVSQCLGLADGERRGSPCRDSLAGAAGPLDLMEQVRSRVEEVVREIGERAPDARVVVATYPQLLPDSGTCPDLVPFAEGDYAFVREVNQALVEAQTEGAEAGGAEVLDVYAASAGHDICSDEPWVNGITTDPSRALAFHPFAVEQRAVADLLLRLLEL